MLQPRETDIPALFLFLVVLPLVAYFLLGRWSEISKKKQRSSLLSQCAGEEAFTTDSMTVSTCIPLVKLPNIDAHECARCYAPSTTRCSRCKFVRYCSGKCQIIHWRQVHKHQCHQLEHNNSTSSLKSVLNEKSTHERILFNANIDSQCKIRQSRQDSFSDHHAIYPSDSTIYSETHPPMAVGTSKHYLLERKSADNWVSLKSKGLRSGDGAILESSTDATRLKAASSIISSNLSKEVEYKLNSMPSEEDIHQETKVGIPDLLNVHTTSRSRMQEQISEPKYDSGISNVRDKNNIVTSVCNLEPEVIIEKSPASEGSTSSDDKVLLNCLSEEALAKRSTKIKSTPHFPGAKKHKSQKSAVKSVYESRPDKEGKVQFADEFKFGRLKEANPARGNGFSSLGLGKIIGLTKSQKKFKMLFPYEEFVKFFECGFFNLSPRGLVNCGNSCYANAVLQCLTCTKPLTIFLLHRSHSRHCHAKGWCLVCELEQHVAMLTESGGPLSPNRILSNMRNINCQIGDGSQEDAHEFLRFLVTSMQSICLEGLGGENMVDIRLQETTYIQHTFGGRLRSKVKCMRCHHESERYESIMDLTLEIFGWVESLEDALTQFTSAEDLDGENMYRCGRCAAYVQARKQLNIQEGNYGKINKCITFPEMLDMSPYMTGTDDIPPLYTLYAVVVHLDRQNASFSGHYVAYVKNLQGSWFRIDDTEVQAVHMSEVMSEGAYILFYMRSCPRPARTYTGKPIRQQPSDIPKHWSSNTQTSSGLEETKYAGIFVNAVHKPETSMCFTNGTAISSNRNRPPTIGTYTKLRNMEFLDAMSSDWSIFTSSDDASFTTESTRDSFSTMDS